ncbi:MAG: glyoxalase [Pseudonocardiales bacterium]|nr:glyoxalase [Pseudonocardiales bacterium]
MAASITVLEIDSHHPAELAAWWQSVLGGEVSVDADGDATLRLASPAMGLDFIRVPELKSIKNRLHLDINPVGCEQGEELERLLALGAVPTNVGQAPDVSWQVLADPEGNEFCLLSTRVG